MPNYSLLIAGNNIFCLCGSNTFVIGLMGSWSVRYRATCTGLDTPVIVVLGVTTDERVKIGVNRLWNQG